MRAILTSLLRIVESDDHTIKYAAQFVVVGAMDGEPDALQIVSNDTIWSIHGSASEVIWPYWWHFIYGGI